MAKQMETDADYVCRRLVERFGRAWESDEDINGSDCVSFVSSLMGTAKLAVIAADRAAHLNGGNDGKTNDTP